MQPTSDQPDRADSPYAAPGEQPYPAYARAEPPRTDSAPWAGPAFAPAVPAATVKKGRPWLVAIVSFLTLLVLIAGLGNQWVTDAIFKHVSGRSFIDGATRAVTTYQWRFSPRGNRDIGHIWLGSLCLVATALVLTLLIVALVCRGPGGFGQAFVGAWMAVFTATQLGTYVRAAVIDANQLIGSSAGSKANVIFFSSLSPNAAQIAAGLGFGFVVGLVAGITAVLGRHNEVISPGVPPGYGAPAFGAGPPVPGPIASPSPWSTSDEASNTQTGTSEPQHTAVLPSIDEPTRASSTQPDNEHTTQLPRTDPSEDDNEGPRHLSE
jgi:hypothetical protein